MSSTNVHSEKQIGSIYCAGAQIIPTEKEVEIPPKSAKKGPSTIDITMGDTIEISVGESELNKNGQLVSKDGNVIAQFSKTAFNEVNKNRNNRKQFKNSSKVNDAEIGD